MIAFMARRYVDTLSPYPDHAFERSLGELVCGVDEAGRGPLAGPVVAAAVILRVGAIPEGIDDSKKLKRACRERVHDALHAVALVGIGQADIEEIDRLNILHASLLAMRRAVEALPVAACLALIDGHMLPPSLPCAAHAIVGGDARCLSIAAASIIAKVTRDRLMAVHAEQYPGYGFERHVGYSTREHLHALRTLGPTPIHRRSFAPVRDALLPADAA